MMITKWDKRFMEMAKLVSSWSKDPSKQIGAVAVRDRRILAQGYNGLPKGLPDTPAYLEDRDVKYTHIIHAEENVIINAARNGVSLEGSTVYIYGLAPCSSCAGKLVNAGVKHIVFEDIHDDPFWTASQKKSEVICKYGDVVLSELTAPLWPEIPEAKVYDAGLDPDFFKRIDNNDHTKDFLGFIKDEGPDEKFLQEIYDGKHYKQEKKKRFCHCGHPEDNHPFRHPFIEKEQTVFLGAAGAKFTPVEDDEEEAPDDWMERQRKRYYADTGE